MIRWSSHTCYLRTKDYLNKKINNVPLKWYIDTLNSIFRKIKQLVGFNVHRFLFLQNTECKSPRIWAARSQPKSKITNNSFCCLVTINGVMLFVVLFNTMNLCTHLYIIKWWLNTQRRAQSHWTFAERVISCTCWALGMRRPAGLRRRQCVLLHRMSYVLVPG